MKHIKLYENFGINETEYQEGREGDCWIVMNDTDGFTASPNTFTKAVADKFIEDFPKRYKAQGYYRTGNGERIDPSEVRLRAVEVPFSEDEE